MNLQECYSQILEKLKRGERPLIKLSVDDLNELKNLWDQTSERESVHKILCVLDNTQTLSSLFDDHIIECLAPSNDEETIIFTLSVASKHIMSHRMRSGDPVPVSFIDTLGELLAHKNPEVLEWSLRTIAELGRAAKRLRPLLIKHRPGFSAIFNVHKRHAQEIIDLIERTWQGP